MTSNVAQSSLSKLITEELRFRKKHERRRKYALSGTVHFAEVSGANVMNEAQQLYPWLPYAENFAEFLDRPVKNIAVPIKLGFIARLHLKTTIAGEALARFTLANPEKRSCIFSWDAQKAQENLSQVSNDFQQKEIQELFPDLLYPTDNKARYYYKTNSVLLKRKGNYKEPSIMALGATSNRTGKHFNGVIWIDDVVTEDNYRNPETQKKIWETIQYIVSCIAEPGCQIWITGTRYAFHDAYGYLLKRNSPLKKNIVKGYPEMGCWQEDKDGNRKSLFSWKYCVTPEEKNLPVEYKGKTYTPVRASLEEMREGMDPILWAAQFLNSPILGGTATFNQQDFENIVPCEGHELQNWLECNGGFIDPEEPERGKLDIIIPGDPAYSAKSHNDNSVLLTVGQDRHDYWYVMDARVTRDGWNGLEAYLEQAYRWKKFYGAREFAIEAHAKQALRTVDMMVSRKLGIRAIWNPLKRNSGGRNGDSKQERIATALESLVRNGRLWFCVPPDAHPNHPVERFRQMIITEATRFPTGTHDDCLDCLANCDQSFRVRSGRNTNRKINMFPRRQGLPLQMRRWCVA